MHDWDIFEDVAIAFGYEHLKPSLPSVATIGKEHPVPALETLVRSVCTGLGYLEVMPFTLTNERVMFDAMQRPRNPKTLAVMRPISDEHTIVRTDILPLLLETLGSNRHRELPQRLFAVGDVQECLETSQKVAMVSMHTAADFSEAYAAADALCRELGIAYSVTESSDDAFLDGRRGSAIVGGNIRGVFGEIHPDVLRHFELEQPVAAVELDLRAVQARHRTL